MFLLAKQRVNYLIFLILCWSQGCYFSDWQEGSKKGADTELENQMHIYLIIFQEGGKKQNGLVPLVYDHQAPTVIGQFDSHPLQNVLDKQICGESAKHSVYWHQNRLHFYHLPPRAIFVSQLGYKSWTVVIALPSNKVWINCFRLSCRYFQEKALFQTGTSELWMLGANNKGQAKVPYFIALCICLDIISTVSVLHLFTVGVVDSFDL